ncbi:ABC transporter ATP-binding protein [Helicobacter sp. MIT 14-3879]|uniref:ABC transporter ATP-binding protein n=1 Tax=Helicobacter sp. MIT 14-3879 TaxID=2040649 RepID=UPI000E1FAE2E|nr:ATP-binding cassette domain-containing protein [Helicobacter sp. MIT 14-3879]RDU63932.1 molybdenum ABC transporter ATP-binding protein [Helicobacter sp. MIT 14-3879]
MIKLIIKKHLNGSNGKILFDINTTIKDNSFVSIFGKSGAGKTTLLRILSGLDSPKEGEIIVDNEVWFSSKNNINIPPQKRKIGFVFQDYALFPHLNVYKNLYFGLKNKNEKYRIDEILELMELTFLKTKYPNELSGGQKQRVALARALVCENKILLLDEPLSALDNEMRSILQEEILKLHRHFKLTTILVSHDIGEIFKLSNRILHIKNGVIFKDGGINEVFGNKEISAKFNFNAKILDIKQEGVIFLVKILINNNITTITADKEILNYKIGDEILVASKAFNPMIFKLK